MKAARIHQYGERLVLEEVPTPQPGPGQVVVKIEGAGFCHIELAPLDRINDVYARLKRGEVEGRAVITPAA